MGVGKTALLAYHTPFANGEIENGSEMRAERMQPSAGYFLVKLLTPDRQLRRFLDDDDGGRASAQIALRWDRFYRRVWDGVGLEGLQGMKTSEALPHLEYAVRKLGKMSGEDILHHKSRTPEIRAGDSLVMFVNLCRAYPDDVLEVQASLE